MKVSFLNLSSANREVMDEINAATCRVASSGRYILGWEVDTFEENFAKYVGAEHCIGVGNGFDALVLSLRALGVGPGDEVIVPSHTFIATWLAVSHCGATLVPAGVSDETYNLDFDSVDKLISNKTKAIIVVHLYGQPADLDAALALKERYGVAIIEDAAQAHGAQYKNKSIGSHGDLVAWSFYPGKNLGALGDGGAVTTNDARLAAEVRCLANYGSREKYVHVRLGVNSRLDPMQAAILSIKLRRLEQWNERRRRVADIYLKNISNSNIRLPVVSEWAKPAWHLFVIASKNRNELQTRLASQGVETLIHYPIPPSNQQAYQDTKIASCLVAEKISAEVLSLPIGPHMTEGEALFVSDAISRLA
jgi:dTDP-4-amino-4,6-dideoxygalactose transaminase